MIDQAASEGFTPVQVTDHAGLHLRTTATAMEVTRGGGAPGDGGGPGDP